MKGDGPVVRQLTVNISTLSVSTAFTRGRGCDIATADWREWGWSDVVLDANDLPM